MMMSQGPPPEYMYSSGSSPVVVQQSPYEYVGVPLEPPQPKTYIIYDEEEEHGPSTAEIIANQSQDYVDERLAEYQMTIFQLQGEFFFLLLILYLLKNTINYSNMNRSLDHDFLCIFFNCAAGK